MPDSVFLHMVGFRIAAGVADPERTVIAAVDTFRRIPGVVDVAIVDVDTSTDGTERLFLIYLDGEPSFNAYRRDPIHLDYARERFLPNTEGTWLIDLAFDPLPPGVDRIHLAVGPALGFERRDDASGLTVQAAAVPPGPVFAGLVVILASWRAADLGDGDAVIGSGTATAQSVRALRGRLRRVAMS